jgi:hypothetical protein
MIIMLAVKEGMDYFARFENINGNLFRFDTRIYLNDYDTSKSSMCVGAIVGKNPGSAIPKVLNELAPLELDGDRMLPTVRNRFIDGYKLAQKNIPINSFVRVWNLFYTCDPDLDSACYKASSFKSLPICTTENESVPIFWYGWGGNDQRLNSFKERFMTKEWPHTFFYDHTESRVSKAKPTINSFAKHTQGMPSKPVNEHLASVV